MSNLTERAQKVIRAALAGPRHDGMNRLTAGRLAVDALAEAGMLTDPPDAEDPRMAAVRRRPRVSAVSDSRLLPAEGMALAIARGQASGGAGSITPDIAAFLVLILNRLLADPDAEDPRITAVWGLVQEWTGQSDAASNHADALGAEYSSIRRVALVPPGARAMVWSASRREARTASDHAAALRRVLDTTGDDDE